MNKSAEIQRENFELNIRAISDYPKDFQKMTQRNGHDYINPIVQVAWEIFQDSEMNKEMMENQIFEQEVALDLVNSALGRFHDSLEKINEGNQALVAVVHMARNLVFEIDHMYKVKEEVLLVKINEFVYESQKVI